MTLSSQKGKMTIRVNSIRQLKFTHKFFIQIQQIDQNNLEFSFICTIKPQINHQSHFVNSFLTNRINSYNPITNFVIKTDMLNQVLNQDLMEVAVAFRESRFSPNKDNLLPSVLRGLTPTGSTALRDSVLQGCLLIIKLYQKVMTTRFADEFNFVMIVLTDGLDECSKSSMADTIEALNTIRDKIPTNALKIFFIGVDIDDGTEFQLRQLADAAGKNAEYMNISTSELGTVFQKITYRLGLEKRHEVMALRNSQGDAVFALNEEVKPYLHMAETFYTVLFNLDMSGSMEGQKWDKLCAGTEYFVSQLGEDDFVGGMVFNHECILLQTNAHEIEKILMQKQNQQQQLNNQNYYNQNQQYQQYPPPSNQQYQLNQQYAYQQFAAQPYQPYQPYPQNNYYPNPYPPQHNVYPLSGPPPVYPQYNPPQSSKPLQTLTIVNSGGSQPQPVLAPFYRRRNGRIGIGVIVIVIICIIIIAASLGSR